MESSSQTKQSKQEALAGKVTLQAYVGVLRRAANGELPRQRDADTLENRLIRELKDSGLLSDAAVPVGSMTFIEPIVLTPSGADALAQWAEFLRKESFGYKFGSSFVRFLWVIVGAICATLPELIR